LRLKQLGIKQRVQHVVGLVTITIIHSAIVRQGWDWLLVLLDNFSECLGHLGSLNATKYSNTMILASPFKWLVSLFQGANSRFMEDFFSSVEVLLLGIV